MANSPTRRKSVTNRLWFLPTLVWALGACAQQMPPPGGPPDTTPPRILAVQPANNATQVPRDQTIEFTFSEGMDRKTLEKAIFITPNPGNRVQFDWDGSDRLRIEFADSLAENRTYVITLGTDLRDAHGNPLAQSYTLAFSTGDQISRGQISGRVYADGTVQGILIWAYILEPGEEPDPTERGGDYVTQTDSRGNYTLSNLSQGAYRVFAIRDKDNNRFFEYDVDDIAVTFGDVTLAADSLTVEHVNFKLASRDVVGPALLSAAAADRHHLALRFDEALDGHRATAVENYTIWRPGLGDTLTVQVAYLNPLDSVEVALVTAQQQAGGGYRVEVRGLTDLAGNAVDPEFDQAEFVGSAVADSIRPALRRATPGDSARAVPLDASVRLYFSEAMHTASLSRAFHLRAREDTVTGRLSWETPASATFKPGSPLRSLTWYTITVSLDSVFDGFGNPAAGDSVFVSRFATLNRDTLSSILGTVVDEDSLGTGRIYLTAAQAGRDYELVLPEPGLYKFADLLPGVYRIEGFRDRDEDGQFNPGRVRPFEPAERFVVYPDSIKVRARWPNEGNDIIFHK